MFKDHFSKQSAEYSVHRPAYPRELFDRIVSHVKERNIAWDCGTGNGQAAVVLADYFGLVIASDASANQIRNARTKDNVIYKVFPAERADIPSRSVDLITVAQALHWFDFGRFFAEAGRVGKPECVVAAWTYRLPKIDDDIDSIVLSFYRDIVGEYWPGERRYVDERYETLPFPFERTQSAEFFNQGRWDLKGLLGYLRTWSSVQKYREKMNADPVELIEADLRRAWGRAKSKMLVWSIYLKIGFVGG